MRISKESVVATLAGIGATAMSYGRAFAQGLPGLPNPIPQAGSSAEDVAITVIQYILAIAGLVAVVYLIIGGFNYITAGGNEENTKKATKTLLNAIIGLVVIFAAYAIVFTIQKNVVKYEGPSVIR